MGLDLCDGWLWIELEVSSPWAEAVVVVCSNGFVWVVDEFFFFCFGLWWVGDGFVVDSIGFVVWWWQLWLLWWAVWLIMVVALVVGGGG